jgi:serine/threonine protein kinase/Tol biopolymer transport system component
MSLSPGTKLGSYEIVSPLGAGGMGEVYRARDTRLGREVALKVLPAAFASDPDRMARFQREAQVLASLNHPRIGAIYGFEDSNGIRALVMELIEGPTLADRIARGAIPVDEALPLAREIAEALEAAHDRGIVHRDLKPANIKITSDGDVKVLDFGLAKAVEGDVSSADIQNSPTISRMATQAGIILGTAAYMSPEQAKGKTVDRRTDIWAFGCVLHEMLTAKHAFEGETVTDTLAAVIRGEPDWTLLPANTPQAVRNLLQRCLKKDPKQRLQSIGEARITLNEVLSGSTQAMDPVQESHLLPTTNPSSPRILPWAVAALLGVALLVALFALRQASRPPAQKFTELSLWIPPDQQLDTITGPAVVISPDGSRLAYVIRDRGSNAGKLYVREMDNRAAMLLSGAGGAEVPFFSPDGQWIGFFGDGKLKKISVRGGAAIALCDATGYRGGTWSEDGTIVFPAQFTSPLCRIPAGGGTPEEATHLDTARSEITHRWPQFLPDGKALLFTASADNNFFEHAKVEVASLDKGVGKVLVENAYFGRYLAGGYLAYVSQGTVFVAPFDAQALKITGTAIPVLQGVDADLSNGAVQLSVAQNGTAVYLSGGRVNQNLNIALLDRKGNSSTLMNDQPDASSPQISPDGRRVAFQKIDGIWVHDLVRGTTSPVTPGSAGASYPVWSPNGEWITYAHPRSTNKGSGQGIFRKRSDGTGEEVALTPNHILNAYPGSWSPDGKVLAFYQLSEKDGSCCELWTLSMDENGKPQEPRRFLQQDSNGKARHPQFSPDGRWLSYVSWESGRSQVYVVPFSGGVGKWQISTNGGVEERWSKAGHELFYISTNGSTLMSVQYSVDKNSFQPGNPQELFTDRFEARAPFMSYDVTPDGQHFVMFQFAGGRATPASQPIVALNWLDQARQLVAAGQSNGGK